MFVVLKALLSEIIQRHSLPISQYLLEPDLGHLKLSLVELIQTLRKQPSQFGPLNSSSSSFVASRNPACLDRRKRRTVQSTPYVPKTVNALAPSLSIPDLQLQEQISSSSQPFSTNSLTLQYISTPIPQSSKPHTLSTPPPLLSIPSLPSAYQPPQHEQRTMNKPQPSPSLSNHVDIYQQPSTNKMICILPRHTCSSRAPTLLVLLPPTHLTLPSLPLPSPRFPFMQVRESFPTPFPFLPFLVSQTYHTVPYQSSLLRKTIRRDRTGRAFDFHPRNQSQTFSEHHRAGEDKLRKRGNKCIHWSANVK